MLIHPHGLYRRRSVSFFTAGAETARNHSVTRRPLKSHYPPTLACQISGADVIPLISFVLLAGASMLLNTLMTPQTAQTGMDTRLAVNVPMMEYGKLQEQVKEFYREAIRAIDAASRRQVGRARQRDSVARQEPGPPNTVEPLSPSSLVEPPPELSG